MDMGHASMAMQSVTCMLQGSNNFLPPSIAVMSIFPMNLLGLYSVSEYSWYSGRDTKLSSLPPSLLPSPSSSNCRTILSGCASSRCGGEPKPLDDGRRRSSSGLGTSPPRLVAEGAMGAATRRCRWRRHLSAGNKVCSARRTSRSSDNGTCNEEESIKNSRQIYTDLPEAWRMEVCCPHLLRFPYPASVRGKPLLSAATITPDVKTSYGQRQCQWHAVQ